MKRLWPADLGKAGTIAGTQLQTVLNALNIQPDLQLSGSADLDIGFQHRRIENGDTDIYFLSNRRNRPENIEAQFRIQGTKPTIWRAETGQRQAVSYRIQNGTTFVPLQMQPEESLFIVFDEPTKQNTVQLPQKVWTVASMVNGPWDVSFQAGRGAPPRVTLNTLESLSDHDDAAIKYFSGVATYRNRLNVPLAWASAKSLTLDLGQVGDVAEVWVNSRYVGTVWKAPYRTDIGGHLHPGVNELEIRVANLWVNRLIGDAQPNAKKITSIAKPLYREDAPLRSAGLIGPVRLLVDKE